MATSKNETTGVVTAQFGPPPRTLPVWHKGKKVAELWLIADFTSRPRWRVRWFRGSPVARHFVDTKVEVLNAQLGADVDS